MRYPRGHRPTKLTDPPHRLCAEAIASGLWLLATEQFSKIRVLSSARFILILKSVKRLLRFARNDAALITAVLSLRGAVGDKAISKLMKRQVLSIRPSGAQASSLHWGLQIFLYDRTLTFKSATSRGGIVGGGIKNARRPDPDNDSPDPVEETITRDSCVRNRLPCSLYRLKNLRHGRRIRNRRPFQARGDRFFPVAQESGLP